MNKTKTFEAGNKITVDINGLQAMLSVGKSTAAKIGSEAEAVIHIGRRTLYNVQRVREYLEGLT